MANCQNSNSACSAVRSCWKSPMAARTSNHLKASGALLAGTSKGFDFNPNSVTSDADDGGGYVETIITNSDFTMSFEGEVRKKDKWISTVSASSSSISLMS
jgi:hypothetical protein